MEYGGVGISDHKKPSPSAAGGKAGGDVVCIGCFWRDGSLRPNPTPTVYSPHMFYSTLWISVTSYIMPTAAAIQYSDVGGHHHLRCREGLAIGVWQALLKWDPSQNHQVAFLHCVSCAEV